MHAYRFRIMVEEPEEFLREIDLLANHTFEDFHKILVSSVGIEGNELASFFICNHRWRKLNEFTLIDMQAEQSFDIDDEDARERKNPIPVQLMSAIKIRDVINDPHQRLIYEYDFLRTKTFFIDLIKIFPSDPEKIYPLVARSVGSLVSKATQPLLDLDENDQGYLPADIESLDDELQLDEDELGIAPEDEPAWQ